MAFTPLPNGLRLHRRIVDDAAPGGNADGIVNPGETVNFPTWILNLDVSVRNGVVGKITKRNPSDPLFSITDSVKSFGDVQPNDSAYTGASGYKIAVSGSAVNGSVLGIDLTIRDVNDSTWVNGYDVAVGAPVLSAAGIVIRDSVVATATDGWTRASRRTSSSCCTTAVWATAMLSEACSAPRTPRG